MIRLFFDFSCFLPKKIKKRLDFPKNRCKLQDILKMPTWRNGRRAAFRSQSPHGGVGSTPIVGTIFSLEKRKFAPFCPTWYGCYVLLRVISGVSCFFSNRGFGCPDRCRSYPEKSVDKPHMLLHSSTIPAFSFFFKSEINVLCPDTLFPLIISGCRRIAILFDGKDLHKFRSSFFPALC